MADFMIYVNSNDHGRQTCTISNLNVNFGITVPTDREIKDYIILVHPVHPDVKDIIPVVQKHILSFFQSSVPSRVEIDEELNNLPQIENVEESTFRQENLEGTFVEHFFSTYPNQTRSKVLSKNIKNLEENSKLFDLDCLYFEYSTIMAPMILKQFKGSCLYSSNAELKMEDVMNFFSKWKSGEGYQNLEYLYIQLNSDQLEPEVTIQLEAKPWDKTKRPRVFYYSPKLLEWLTYYGDPYINCQNFSDIEREDGRLASIHIASNFLEICVWTDSQLKMNNNA